MTTTTKLMISAALIAVLSAPASARIEGDEGGSSAYPFRGNERAQMMTDFRAWNGVYVNRPRQQR